MRKAIAGPRFRHRLACCALINWHTLAMAADATVKTIAHGLQNPHDVSRPARRWASRAKFSSLIAVQEKLFACLRIARTRSMRSSSAFRSPSPMTIDDTAAAFNHLHFLDHLRLVVAGTDHDGSPFTRLYELQDVAGAVQFNDQKQSGPVSRRSDCRQSAGFERFTTSRARE